MSKKLRGSFDSQVPAEVETCKDTFKISVSSDEEGSEPLYKNAEEPYEYQKVPSLATALNLLGAELSDEQYQFLTEALRGEKAGPAVLKLIEVFNEDLRVTAKNNAYQRVFNLHKPVTEENIGNSKASMVRNFMKLSSVSDETAIEMLKTFNAKVFGDYTVADFRGNKGKR